MTASDGGLIDYLEGVRFWRSESPGDPGDVLIVCLPGFGAGLEFLVPLARQLALHYEVIALDLPGFGATPWLNAHSIDDTAHLLSRVVSVLSPKPVVIVAQSVGAMVAMRMAPCLNLGSVDKCRGLGLLGGAQRDSIRWAQRPGQTLVSEPAGFLLGLWTLVAASIPLPDGARRKALQSRFARRATLWPYLSEPGQSDGSLLDEVLVGSGSTRAVSFARHLHRFDVESAVRDAGVPLALLTGEDDRYVSEEDREFYRDSARVQVDDLLPGAGHWITVEAFDDTVQWLTVVIPRLVEAASR